MSQYYYSNLFRDYQYTQFIKSLPINKHKVEFLYEDEQGILLIPKVFEIASNYGMLDKELFDSYTQESPIYIWTGYKKPMYFWFGWSIDIRYTDGSDIEDMRYLVSEKIINMFLKSKEKEMSVNQLVNLSEILKIPFDREIEERIVKSYSTDLFWYMRNVGYKRVKWIEDRILDDVEKIYGYAKFIIEGRWREAEKYILKQQNHKYMFLYARDVIKGRWKEAEKYMIRDAATAYYYARDVIRERWKYDEDEQYIMRDPLYAYYYARDVIRGRWRTAERYIMKDENVSRLYGRDVMEL